MITLDGTGSTMSAMSNATPITRQRTSRPKGGHGVGQQRNPHRLGDAETGQEGAGEGECDPELAAHERLCTVEYNGS